MVQQRLKRVVKSPKLQFMDSGLLSTLMNLGEREVNQDRVRFGQVLETFVFAELLRLCAGADEPYQLMYYRDDKGLKVDVVIENANGELIGVEIKASATPKMSDLKGLKQLAKLAGEDFKLGVLLYDGEETLPLGDKMWACPVSSLWGHQEAARKSDWGACGTL